jgi:hypothetical protein
MKLSKSTIDIIKNFSTINQGMLFKPGKQLKTVSPQKNILAVANIEDSIDGEFAIYDLNQFLAVVSLTEENSFEIEGNDLMISKSVSISDNESADISVVFRSASKNMIVAPPEKDIQFPEPEINLVMTSKIINMMYNYASVLGSPHVGFESDGKDVYLSGFDSTGSKSHMSKIRFADGNGDTFSLSFKLESLRLFPGDYDLHISSKGVSHWKNKNVDIEYWITVEPGSTYQKG